MVTAIAVIASATATSTTATPADATSAQVSVIANARPASVIKTSPEPTDSSGRTNNASAPADTPVTIDQPLQGKQALNAIAQHISTVASSNAMSVSELTKTLSEDSTAWLGRSGQLYFAEAPQPASVVESPPSVGALPVYPLGQTFNLHSSPGSNRTIYLDFDGYDLAPTNSWVNYQNMPSKTYGGFTLDGNASTFTSTELAHIQAIWRIVSEKYAAFDVDVTTEDVGSSKWDRASGADQEYGTRVVITNDPSASQAACGNTCSGVAWIGQFNATTSMTDYWQPAWVFSNLTYGSVALTANTIAHEIGHTVGLNHDGTTTDAYYGGHSNWSPLMGGGVNGVQQFSRGEYVGANNTEDDFAKMGTKGLAIRGDDYPNTIEATTPAPALDSQTFSGLITSQNDTDVFGFNITCPANLAVVANGIGEGSMLDILVEVLNSAGTVIASGNPISGQDTSYWPALPTGLDASTAASTNATGNYFVRLRGVGKGNPANTGYSAYSSIGSYSLQVTKTCTGPENPIDTPPVDQPPVDPGDQGEPVPDPQPQPRSPSTLPLVSPLPQAFSGARGGPKTVRASWTGLPGASHYAIEINKLNKRGRTVATKRVTTTSTSMEVRVGAGQYQMRMMAVGLTNQTAWSSWSPRIRAR
ncbi:MAG: M12 family metallo-peptidase [Nocardioidaceae bacterium]